eukprot:1554425-Pyramimonas_sp.AAC.1
MHIRCIVYIYIYTLDNASTLCRKACLKIRVPRRSAAGFALGSRASDSPGWSRVSPGAAMPPPASERNIYI